MGRHCRCSFALTLGLFLLFLLAPTVAGRRTGFFTGIATLVFMAFAFSFSVSQKNEYMNADRAIVMRPVTSVKSSPSSESTKDLFVLHEGTKVKVLDTVGSGITLNSRMAARAGFHRPIWN